MSTAEVLAPACKQEWPKLRRGWWRLNKAWNIASVHPLPGTGGKTLVFVCHLILSRLGVGVINLVGYPTRFLGAKVSVHRIRQQLRHSVHLTLLYAADCIITQRDLMSIPRVFILEVLKYKLADCRG